MDVRLKNIKINKERDRENPISFFIYYSAFDEPSTFFILSSTNS